MRNEALLQKLCQIQGVAGYEGEVRKAIRAEIEPYADEIIVDAMGNLIALKKGSGAANGKRIMLAAHMDEVGYMVKKIEADGRLRVCSVGFNWASAAFNERVRFRNGLIGMVGANGGVPDGKNEFDKLYIDIGAKDKADAEQYVHVGDVCAYCEPYVQLVNERICSQALDDRLGCFQLIEAMRENDGKGPNDVYYVFTVQEEVGTRGSKTAANRIQPDIGVAVDITPAHDYPGNLEGSNTVGAGTAIKIYDPSVISDEEIVAAMIDCCEKNGIRYQRDVIDRGGTDSSSMNQAGLGARTGGISVAMRYPHCQSSVVSKDDIEEGIKLIAAFCAYPFTF